MQQVSQEEIVKIQPKGLVTIPKKLRQQLGLEENTLVNMRGENGILIVEPLHILPYPIRNYTKSEIDEFIKLDKKETKILKSRGSIMSLYGSIKLKSKSRRTGQNLLKWESKKAHQLWAQVADK